MTNFEIIKYRRARAMETFDDARLLLDSKKYFSAANRVYYAIFYQVNALLLSRGLSSPKHSGVRSLFNLNFVKTGLVDIKHSQFYNQMFDFRQKADYADMIELPIDTFPEIMRSAEEFLAVTDKLFGA